jgi:S1-C subfamily serine protease
MYEYMCRKTGGGGGGASKPGGSSARGSGFVIDTAGLILTNEHVVEKCTNVSVRLPDGMDVSGAVVARDASNDIALIKVDRPLRKAGNFRPSSIMTGEAVTAIGFPMSGLLADQANASTGIVSATAGLRNDSRYLQISAPINPGNSGGPVLDDSGQVVGMVVAKLDALAVAKSTGDVPSGIAFAIKNEALQGFLGAQSVKLAPAAQRQRLQGHEVASIGKDIAVRLTCNPQTSRR